MKTEASLLREIAAAPTLREQAALVSELDALRSSATRQVQASRDTDLAGAIVRDTFTPVRVHEHHTASTDWLEDVATTQDPTVAHQQVMAQASLWFGKTAAEVKADNEEFSEQARGMARRVAGAYGEEAPAAERAFLDYVAFLHRREAASGLDQIQQTVDGNNMPKKTPLPTETFDTFEDPVAPENQGVDEMQSSYNAPLLNEILQEGAGQGQPEWNQGHTTTDNISQNPMGGSGMPVGQRQSSLVDVPSVAVNHVMTLDQFVAEQKTAAAKPEPRPFAEARRTIVERVERTAASGLPQIQQLIDANNEPEKTDLPTEVAFPLVATPEMQTTDGSDPTKPKPSQHNSAVTAYRWEKECPHCGHKWTSKDKHPGTCPECHASLGADPKEGSRKQADMFGGGDAPHGVPGQPTQDNPTDYPVQPNGDRAAGEAAGRKDAADPNARPTFADASSSTDPYVQGYVDGYTSVPVVQQRNDVPPSVSQDRTKGNSVPQMEPVAASLKRHAGLVTQATLASKDFRKAYRFASTYDGSKPIVRTGSVEFESGLYAGMLDNPSAEGRAAWLRAHATWGEKDPQFKRRIALHRAFSASKQAVTGAFEYGDKVVHPEFGKGTVVGTSSPGTGGPIVTVQYGENDTIGKDHRPSELRHQSGSKQAGTSTDLDTMSPDASPTRNTPFNGPGTPPPLEGGMDPAAPGGAAPYNGAPPYSSPVAPDPGWMDPQKSTTGQEPQYGPVPMTPAMAAFRQSVQAALLAQNTQES